VNGLNGAIVSARFGRRAAVFAAGACLSPAFLAAQQADPAAGTFVDSITVEGNVRLTDEEILTDLGLQPRTTISFRDIQTALKALWATGQYRDYTISAQGGQGGEPVLLVLDVEEQDVMESVTIEGLERLSVGSVRDTADLRAGEPYSPQKLAIARDFIRNELADDGIPFARIDERVEEVPDRPGHVRLVLEVTEGQRVTVSEVEFTGNEHVGADDLRSALDTQAEGFWWFRQGSYQESTLQEDLLARLPELYRSRGYLDFAVLRDTLVIDPETGKSRLEVAVEEGPRYRVREFVVEGNSRFPTDRIESFYQPGQGGLLSSFGIGGDDEENPVFDAAAFEAAAAAVGSLYRNNGYLGANVEPFYEFDEANGDGDPTLLVGWRIQEGAPAYIRRVEVEGNDYTHERVVRDQLFSLPGDIYSEERLIQSYQAVSALGYFETPMELPALQPADDESGNVDIVFRVKERQTGTVNFGTSMGGGYGLSGFLGYDQPNLFGQAKSGSVRWDFGRYINNFTLSYTDPSLRRTRVSGTVSLFYTRDRFFQFTTGQRRLQGGSLRFGLPLPGSLRTRLFLGYSLSRTKYDLFSRSEDSSLFGRDPGTLSTLSASIQRQTLNHNLFPTQGSRQVISAEMNGGLLGGDGDFMKYAVEGTWFAPVGQIGSGARPIRTALGLSVRAGMIFGNAERFPFDRYWMGGVQFGERLRGYDETTITPAGFFDRGSGSGVLEGERLGNAFMSLTVEYDIRFNDSMSLGFFYDAGNVWVSAAQFTPTRLFRGAGVGAQLVTPFGPLGLDYAYGFDKTNPGWQLHFRMGPGF
jgi:outer membrane protein insertion porin family